MPYLADGGIGTALWEQRQELPCVDLLCSVNPVAVQALHRSFLEAGAEILTTNSFACDRHVLSSSGWAEDLEGLCLRSAILARASALGRAQVAGSIGPGWLSITQGQIESADLQHEYFQRARGLLRGGVDLLWIETVHEWEQAQAAVLGCRAAMAVLGLQKPIALLLSPSAQPNQIGGHFLDEVLPQFLALEPDWIGANCGRGPASLIPTLRYLQAESTLPLIACANAHLPEYHLQPDMWVHEMEELIQAIPMLEIVGGCCGVGPAHLQALRRVIQYPTVSIQERWHVKGRIDV